MRDSVTFVKSKKEDWDKLGKENRGKSGGKMGNKVPQKGEGGALDETDCFYLVPGAGIEPARDFTPNGF